jgi:hypothetical protein
MAKKCNGKKIYTGKVEYYEEETVVEQWQAPSAEQLKRRLKANAKPDFTFPGKKMNRFDWKKSKCPKGCERIVRDSNTVKGVRSMRLRTRYTEAENQFIYDAIKTTVTVQTLEVSYICVKSKKRGKFQHALPITATNTEQANSYRQLKSEMADRIPIAEPETSANS